MVIEVHSLAVYFESINQEVPIDYTFNRKLRLHKEKKFMKNNSQKGWDLIATQKFSLLIKARPIII